MTRLIVSTNGGDDQVTIDAISNQAVCAGSTVSGVTITGSVASTVYTWANNTTSIGLGASGTGNITSFTGVNATNIPVVATVTVTPTYTNNSVACVGSTSTFTITINPKPVVPNQTATICSGTAFTTAPTNNPTTTIIPSGTTYTWTVVDNTNVTGDLDVSGNITLGGNITIGDQTIDTINEPKSNFYEQLRSALHNISVFGIGGLIIDEDNNFEVKFRIFS